MTDIDSDRATLLKSLEARITMLEDGEKSLFKKITRNASVSALFLGLVLSGISLYDALWVKPEEARITRISQFNEAVNSAAKIRQDVMKLQAETADPMLRAQIMSMATPQILNNISTAHAILRNLDDEDIEISQLTVLINEAAVVGDMVSVGAFVSLAVSKQNVPPALRSEAKRYQGKFMFTIGDPASARAAYQESVDLLGPSPLAAAARAYVMLDWSLLEFAMGDCGLGTAKLQSFADNLGQPTMPPEARLQMTAAARTQLLALQEQHCKLPAGFDQMLPELPG